MSEKGEYAIINKGLIQKEQLMSSLEDVLTVWQNNYEFKQQFKKNPEKALADAGLVLEPKDLEKIKKLLTKDEELDKRINK
jgi:hypothetical protein